MTELVDASIGFIGGGNMAAALIGGLLGQGASRERLVALDPSEPARAALAERFGVRVAPADGGATAGLAHCDVIVLAVKPQQMRAACQALVRERSSALVISIAAGIRTGDLARWLPESTPIVRTMPNTPALIGRGATALFAHQEVSTLHRRLAEAVMTAVGSVVWVDDEALLDVVTALSGSGPAYFFYVMEALEAAAIAQGLPAATAHALALDTAAGAAALAQQSDESLTTLRERVTSKGGTTHAALEALRTAEVAESFARAIDAATRRSRELGDEVGKLP